MASSAGRLGAARVVAVAGVLVLAGAVLALSVFAYRSANPAAEGAEAAPVPSFTLGVQTATPTPTPTPTPELSRESERFLAAGTDVLWRGVAGECGVTEPLLERSVDDGRTWTDTTPRYRGIAQLISVDMFSGADPEIVAAIGDACEVQGLRSFTAGQFWEPYPEVLSYTRFVDATDPAVVSLGDTEVAAPCAAASGLRARGDTVALVCEGTASVWSGVGWVALAAPAALAVAIDDADVIVAHTTPDCAGVTLSRFSPATPDAALAATCAADVPAAEPLALVTSDGEALVWSGDAVTRTLLP